jgi:hypothetical protein
VRDEGVEPPVVVEVGEGDRRRVVPVGVGETDRRAERPVALIEQHGQRRLWVIVRHDEVESAVAVEVARRDVLRKAARRVLDVRAERPVTRVERDADVDARAREVGSAVAVEVGGDVIVADDRVIPAREGRGRLRLGARGAEQHQGQ